MSLRFGVAGTGYWAETVHLSVLASHPDTKLVGVWGRDPHKAEALAKKFDIASFRRFDDLLAQVDALSIALPPQIQAALALMAAEARKHLVLEKPLAMTPASARAIVASLERNRLTSMVFFLRRFVPEIERAIELGRRASWTSADVRVHSSALLAGSPYAGSSWRQADGAALWNIGPHVLSVLIPVLGAVDAVEAAQGSGKYVRFSTRHAGGAAATISLTLRADPGDTTSRYAFRRGGRELTLPEPEFSRPAAFARAISEFAAAVRCGDIAHRASAGFGAEIVDVLASVARSFDAGGPVVLARSSA